MRLAEAFLSFLAEEFGRLAPWAEGEKLAEALRRAGEALERMEAEALAGARAAVEEAVKGVVEAHARERSPQRRMLLEADWALLRAAGQALEAAQRLLEGRGEEAKIWARHALKDWGEAQGFLKAAKLGFLQPA